MGHSLEAMKWGYVDTRLLVIVIDVRGKATR
jgi:hypothetical protein